ncbi:hypothetical protein EUGRSUZ_K02973 [Eucalyptus grandis]|uniref:Uncharacterized protein n=2 Tax=Eucalyptus grandis TaxID=71139 RepID=A0ACC3J057_EUCGR|nr:hypothetical protein EUGRSUZ_K02973 [Eucalyptus grandis]
MDISRLPPSPQRETLSMRCLEGRSREILPPFGPRQLFFLQEIHKVFSFFIDLFCLHFSFIFFLVKSG